MKFWAAGPRPLSAGGSLEPIIERYQAGVEPARPQATASSAASRPIGPYLAQMSEHYHALRPLRVVVDSASRPTVDFLQRLAATVACEIIPSRSTRNELPRQIRDDAAHFAVCIDGDGETCRVLDEQGREVPPERLLLLLGRTQSIRARCRRTHVVVLETETSPARGRSPGTTRNAGRHEQPAPGRHGRRHARTRRRVGRRSQRPILARRAGLPLCDALMTVTRLLIALSRSDEPLSQVLDRDAPFG